jgi:enoyl-CoA hydratase/carnithine racemase
MQNFVCLIQVAFVNGIAMGSGASLAVTCTFRVVTENTVSYLNPQ